MACSRGIIISHPIRSSLSSMPPPFSLSRIPVSGKFGFFRSWPKNCGPMSPIYAPKFEFMSSIRRSIVHHLNLSGRKFFGGSFLGLSAVAAVMYNRPIVAYAMNDHYADLGGASGFLKDDLHTFWSLAMKFELLLVLLLMVLLGWRHPIKLSVNIAALVFFTKPTPLSIYMFIEQLRQRDMRLDPRPYKTKFLYVKNVKVDDYGILCLAKVELRDVKLDVVGILGGWWVVQTSPS